MTLSRLLGSDAPASDHRHVFAVFRGTMGRLIAERGKRAGYAADAARSGGG